MSSRRSFGAKTLCDWSSGFDCSALDRLMRYHEFQCISGIEFRDGFLDSDTTIEYESDDIASLTNVDPLLIESSASTDR